MRPITGLNPERGPKSGFLWLIEGIPSKAFAHTTGAGEEVDYWDAVFPDTLSHAYVLASSAVSRIVARFLVAINLSATIASTQDFPQFKALVSFLTRQSDVAFLFACNTL